MIDLSQLRDWPDYEDNDSSRFDFVDWPAASSLALSRVELGAEWEPLAPPRGIPDSVRTGVELLISGMPIDASRNRLTDGGHRLLAMKNQGVRYTVGVAYLG